MKTEYKSYRDTILWGKSISDCKRPIGPCSISSDGYVYFSTHPKITHLGRKKGPATIFPNGVIAYYKFGSSTEDTLHRTDGPAFIDECGRKEYWVNGVQFFSRYGDE